MKSFFVDNPLDFEGIPISVSISFGISCVEEGINDVNELLKKADTMLYRAKEHKGMQHPQV